MEKVTKKIKDKDKKDKHGKKNKKDRKKVVVDVKVYRYI